MEKYTGPLDLKKMEPTAKRAYRIWGEQRFRCSNPRSPSYPTYGKKGIKVAYSSRDFISWFTRQDLKPFKYPVVGRVDHGKNYCFENIRIEERVDNIRERNERCGNPGRTSKKVRVGKRVFPSKVAAAQWAGVEVKTVYNHCEGRVSAPRFFWYE